MSPAVAADSQRRIEVQAKRLSIRRGLVRPVILLPRAFTRSARRKDILVVLVPSLFQPKHLSNGLNGPFGAGEKYTRRAAPRGRERTDVRKVLYVGSSSHAPLGQIEEYRSWGRITRRQCEYSDNTRQPDERPPHESDDSNSRP